MEPLPVRYRDSVSADFAIAAVVCFLFVCLPVLAYTDYPGIFGAFANLKLYGIAAFGMAASFALFVGRGQRLVAVFPGLLAGVGGIFLYFNAPALHSVLKVVFPVRWSFFVLAIGALPGVLLLFLVYRYRRCNSSVHSSSVA